MFTFSLYTVLGILEVITVILVWAGVMSFKWRRACRDVAALRQQLMEAPIVDSPIGAAAPATAPGAEAPTDASSVDETAHSSRGEIDMLQEQIGHLRKVIDNQHAVMGELRTVLEKQEGEAGELQEALRKLNDAQTQAGELNRNRGVIEHENQRLKDTHGATHKGGVVNPDADLLRDLVGAQQRTIGELRSMLRAITPEGGKADELEAAINKIQRSNNELNSCVLVLEDENNMLRGQVETLRGRLADREADTLNEQPHAALAAAGPGDDAAASGAGLETSAQAAPEAIAEPIPELTQVVMEAPGDVVVPMEATAIQVAPVSTDAGVDDLLESFSRGAAPAPPGVPAAAEKPAAPADTTDALLAELFGGTPPASR